jgi:hypothetical protein
MADVHLLGGPGYLHETVIVVVPWPPPSRELWVNLLNHGQGQYIPNEHRSPTYRVEAVWTGVTRYDSRGMPDDSDLYG